jgi:hypothetical protein
MAVTMTVTSTASGGTDTAAVLAVTVLTGAAAVQNGATYGGSPVPAEAAITPHATGSLVLGVVQVYPGPSSLVPTAATTLWPGSSDYNAAGGCAYGAFYSTSTAASTPITLGVSSPAGEFNALVMVEILAAGALAVDASSPPAETQGVGVSLTTASFTPPAGSLLVVQATALANSISISSSPPAAWTLMAVDGQTGVWIATAPPAPLQLAGAGTGLPILAEIIKS